jgi:arsenate reductase
MTDNNQLLARRGRKSLGWVAFKQGQVIEPGKLTRQGAARQHPPMADRIFNVLFLCKGNSARSIMAEAILNKLGAGRFRAFSAGSHPESAVHPLALKELLRSGLPTEGLTSKDWNVFAALDAPEMDFIFTVCDSTAGETCPRWRGRPFTSHWGIEDLVSVEGSDAQKDAAFSTAARYLRNRIAVFLSLPLRSLNELVDEARLRESGGASRTVV